MTYIPDLFYPVGVPLPSALADVHLCGVDTAWLWVGVEGDRMLRFFIQIVFIEDSFCSCSSHLLSDFALVAVTHHRPMDVPECSLLAVQNLPLRLVLLPVDPTISRKKPQREHVWQISGMRHRHANTPRKEDRSASVGPQQSRPGLTSTYITDIY